jgi:hypothetical protein
MGNPRSRARISDDGEMVLLEDDESVATEEIPLPSPRGGGDAVEEPTPDVSAQSTAALMAATGGKDTLSLHIASASAAPGWAAAVAVTAFIASLNTEEGGYYVDVTVRDVRGFGNATNVATALLERGAAWVIGDGRGQQRKRHVWGTGAMERARAARRGLWGVHNQPSPLPPWRWRQMKESAAAAQQDAGPQFDPIAGRFRGGGGRRNMRPGRDRQDQPRDDLSGPGSL